MAKLIIRNIGPIKDADIELTRLNIFMGPQSSGKSTIAKLISFCQWLEKDCVRQQKITHIDENFTRKNLVGYHNIDGYLRSDSYFQYRSETLKIEYNNSKLIVKRAKGFKTAKLSKNAYIPSERNLVSLPGIFQTKMPDNYILDFLRDWKQVRKEYTSVNISKIMPTGDSYYFDDSRDEDIIVLKDGKLLPLSQVSSGLQAVTPLVVYVNYVADWIYSHPGMTSADNREDSWEAALANVLDTEGGDDFSEEGVLDIMNDPESPAGISESFRVLLQSIRNSYAHFNTDANDTTKEVIRARERLSKPSFSNIVIEEPEMNLFPETQRLLVEYLLCNHNAERDTMVITTHSPFVLYSINNCMMAFLASQHEPKEMVSEVAAMSKDAFTDPTKVHVWELKDGYIVNSDKDRNKTIQDERGLIRDNYFERVMNNVMCDFRNLISITI